MPRAFPWVYPYQEDGPRLGTVVLRPIVPVTLAGADIAPASLALVDSGSEHVLAAPWLASAVGVDPEMSHRLTMSRLAQQVAVDSDAEFDRRYGVRYVT